MSDEVNDTAADAATEPEAAAGASTGAQGPSIPSPPRPSEIASLTEKVFMMGLGAASLTKEKFDSLADELVERGKVSTGEAREVADWMSRQASKQAEAVESGFARTTDGAMSTAGMATKKDVEELREQIIELKAMLASSRGVSAE